MTHDILIAATALVVATIAAVPPLLTWWESHSAKQESARARIENAEQHSVVAERLDMAIVMLNDVHADVRSHGHRLARVENHLGLGQSPSD